MNADTHALRIEDDPDDPIAVAVRYHRAVQARALDASRLSASSKNVKEAAGPMRALLERAEGKGVRIEGSHGRQTVFWLDGDTIRHVDTIGPYQVPKPSPPPDDMPDTVRIAGREEAMAVSAAGFALPGDDIE